MIEKDPFVRKIIRLALEEDIGDGDRTTDSIIKEEKRAFAKLIAKEDFILAGLPVFKQVFIELSSDVYFEDYHKDGDLIKKGEVICAIKGPAHIILKAERTALNFLQRMSGIATLTKRFVEKAKGIRIVDTRKTAPCLRIFDKYAVRIGGGFNHRFGLFDGILIKDNHIAVVGSVKRAVELAKKNAPHTLKIEVEVESLDQLKEAIEAGADAVLLDNMTLDQIKEAVRIGKGKVLLEVSGGVSLENIEDIAKTGVDIISVGMITHSVKGVDISLELKCN